MSEDKSNMSMTKFMFQRENNLRTNKSNGMILNLVDPFLMCIAYCVRNPMIVTLTNLVGGIPTPLKNMSQLGWFFPTEWKNKNPWFQTTNQTYIYIHKIHFPVIISHYIPEYSIPITVGKNSILTI